MEGAMGTTMSVRAMGRMLGLKKTESYYLVHKGVFETILVSGKMRVVRDSFEAWYAHQDRYRMTDGPAPGAMLHTAMYSIREIAAMLGLAEDTILDLVHRERLMRLTIDGKFWIPKPVFDSWYASQTRYRTAEVRERDRQAEEASMTVPEMGRMIGLDQKRAWNLYHRHKDSLEMIRIAGKPRITKASFHRWLNTQDKYHLIEPRKPVKPKAEREYVTIPEAAGITGLNAQRIHRLLKSEHVGKRKVGRVWYVRLQDLFATLS